MHIQFAELPVFDQDRAIAFYVDNLGCEVASDAPMGRRRLAVGGAEVRRRPHGAPLPPPRG